MISIQEIDKWETFMQSSFQHCQLAYLVILVTSGPQGKRLPCLAFSALDDVQRTKKSLIMTLNVVGP